VVLLNYAVSIEKEKTNKQTLWLLFRKQTILTDQQLLVSEF
jgi:hypothetical protein